MSTRETCSTCAHWHKEAPDAADGQCRANPPAPSPSNAPALPMTLPGFWCGRWRSPNAAFHGPKEKITDAQILETLRGMGGGVPMVMLARDLVKRFHVSRRTADARILAGGERGLWIVEKSPLDKSKFVQTMETFRELNGETTLEFEPAEPAAPGMKKNAKYSFAGDLEPVFLAKAFDAAHAMKYAHLKRECPQMGASAFDRVLREGIESGRVLRTEENLYHLA